MAKKRNRRRGYWRVYDHAAGRELEHLIQTIVQLVEEEGSPWPEPESRRGRPRVHSHLKLATLAMLTLLLNLPYRKMESLLRLLKPVLPWNEPSPDHSTIHAAVGAMPEGYAAKILERSSQLCIQEARWLRGLLAVDSTGVGTDRYEEAVIAMKDARRRVHLKFHVLAILDYNIILMAQVTDETVGDAPTFRKMLNPLPDMEGSVLNGDKAYDADENYELVYSKKMRPNIKQRETGGKNRGKRFRRRAAEEFNPDIYRYRGLVEAIFGAKEVKSCLRTHCRLRHTRRLWGIAQAIGHNMEVLNRLECAQRLDVALCPLLPRIQE